MTIPSPDTLSTLLLQEDQPTILAAALQIAQTLGLPVTSWLAGDPTRSMYMLEATKLAALEQIITGYIQSGFLDYAAIPNADGSTNPWLAIVAQEVFNYQVPQATAATCSVTLTNAGGAVYTIEPGDLTFVNAVSGATYHNTTGCTLTGVGTAGATQTVTVVADQAGSASSASAGEISALVTQLLGVTCTNPTAAVGTDQQDAQTVVAQCRAKQASFSPNGPADAYTFVALNPALTGSQVITRARAYPNSETGNVTIYVASATGGVGSSDVSLVQTAINTYATPLCITPTVYSANPVVVNVTYTMWIYQSVNQTAQEIQTAVQTALETMFASRKIGGDIIPPAATGDLYQSLIYSTIADTFPEYVFRVTLQAPTSDTPLTNDQVATLGAVMGTINLISG